MNFQPMTIQQDQRVVSEIFFLSDELPAHDDTTGLKGDRLKYFFPGMNFQPMTIQPDLKVSVSNIFSQG